VAVDGGGRQDTTNRTLVREAHKAGNEVNLDVGLSGSSRFHSRLGIQAAADGGGGQDTINEFKTLVREAHKAGIEVILDVVFNHTAEGNEQGPTISFR